MNLSRDTLISLVGRICAADGSEEEINGMLQQLETAMPSVPWQSFIFWPAGHPHPPDAYEPTPTEIVDRALAYTPSIIILPPAPTA